MYSEFPLIGGVTRFPVSWPYLERSHVLVQVDGVPVVPHWLSDTLLEVTDSWGGPYLGTKLTMTRVTPDTPDLADIKDTGNLTAAQLNRLRLQLLYLIQERSGGITGALAQAVTAAAPGVNTITGNLDHIQNILDGLTADLKTLDDLNADLEATTTAAAQTRQQFLDALNDTNAKFVQIVQRLDTLQNQQNGYGAMVSNEASLRTDETRALSMTVEKVRSDFEAADGLLRGQVETVSGALTTAEKSLASRIDTVQASAAGDNLFPNPTFVRGIGWTDSDILDRSAAGVPAAAPADRVLIHKTRDYAVTPDISVTPGEVFDAEVWAGLPAAPADTSAVGLILYTYNAAGVLTSYPRVATAPPSFTGWKNLSGAYTVPTGIVRVRCVLWAERPWGSTDPIYFAGPVFRRKPAAVAAVENAATASVTRLGVVESQQTLKVVARTDGKKAVAGIGMAATASGDVAQSELILMGDRVLLTSSDDPDGATSPLMVAGTVNGVPTTVFPAAKVGDKTVGARMLVDGAIEARHMLLKGGAGSSLWLDTNAKDKSAWKFGDHGAAADFAEVTDGVTGSTALQGRNQSMDGWPMVPVIAGKRYRISCYARAVGGANGGMYLRYIYGASEGIVIGQGFTGVGPQTDSSGSSEGIVPPASWTRYSWQIVAGAGSKFIAPRVILNWGGTAGYHQVQDLRIEEMIDGSLVVEGGITAKNIDSEGLTIKQNGRVILGAGTGLPADLLPAEGKNAMVPVSGGNLLRNSRWIGRDLDGWYVGWTNGPGTGRYQSAQENGWSADYALNGTEGAAISMSGGGVASTNGGSVLDLYGSQPVPVKPNTRYCFAVLMNPHRAWGSVHVRLNDAAGNGVSWPLGWESYAAPQYQGNSSYRRSTTLADYQLAYGFIDVPASGIASASLMIRVSSYAGVPDPFVFLARAMFVEVAPGQTAAPPWDAGTPQINANNVTTFIADAAIGTLQVGVLSARNLTVGAISDTVNGGATSNGRVTITTNKVSVYDASGTLRNVMGYLL